MPDPSTDLSPFGIPPPIDPNSIAGQMGNPVIGGLMGAAGGFAQAAMPQPFRMPFGAVLGMGAQGMGVGMENAYRSQALQAQAQQAQMQTALQREQFIPAVAQARAMGQAWTDPSITRNFFSNMPFSMAPSGGGGSTVSPPSVAPVQPPGTTTAPTDVGVGATGKPGVIPPAPKLGTVIAPTTGAKLSVAEPYVDRFQGLVSDLDAAGYKIDPATSGGYNPRFIAGTNTPSEHAFGRAIDLNWKDNPQGGANATIPPDLAHSLAAKYGLVWGGDWSGDTRDPMHFEVAKPFQVASSSGAVPAPGSPAPAPGGLPSPGGMPTNPSEAWAAANQLNRQAAQIEAFQKLYGPAAPLLMMRAGIPPIDPQTLRDQAKQLMDVVTAGPKAAATKAAELPYVGPTVTAQEGAKFPYDMAKLGFRQNKDGSFSFIPGSAADPAYKSSVASGEALAKVPAAIMQHAGEQGVSNVTIRGQGAWLFNPTTGQREWKGEQLPTTLIGSDGTEFKATQTVPEPGTGQRPSIQLVTESNGAPAVAKASPTLQAFRTKYGDTLADQFMATQAEAAAAKEGNYQFDNMRTSIGKFAGWTPDMFAPARNEANQMFLAMGHSLGLTDAQMPELNKGSANYVDFGKNAGQVLRSAVKATGSRVGVQEYSLIGETLPSHATPEQTFMQLADQYQGLNDYHVAKEQFMRDYTNHPQDFQADWDAKISPTAFMINRMTQTPEGQQRYNALIQRLVDSGHQADATAMIHEYATAKGLHLFDGLPR